MKKTIQPLAEVFGYLITDQSVRAERYRSNRLCPFNNKVPNCTKDKAKNPLGVCSIFFENKPVITCPIRFREDWLITGDAATFFFDEGTKWSSLTEVRLNDSNDKSAGNIDVVLVAYDIDGRIRDFGALEIQAVYISGNVRDPFEYYMKNPKGHTSMDWSGQPNCPRPDYLSSSRKRLAPQLLFKGGILHSWQKRTAVALNKSFFDTLPPMKQTSRSNAEVAWLIYDLECINENGRDRYKLKKIDEVFTEFKPALFSITTPLPGRVDEFVKLLQEKLDEQLETPPINKNIKNHSEMTTFKQQTLFPEMSENIQTPKPVNVASVPKRSPFRYPGGKTWFVPTFRDWISQKYLKPKILVEPFAGGGIISLTALFENFVSKSIMVEIDEEIAAVWQAVIDGDAEWLARRILTFNLTKEAVIEEITKVDVSIKEKAFQTILKNRTFHGGILAEGSGFLKHGENGKGIRSRWYPMTLAQRLINLNQVANRIDFRCDDGLKIIQEFASQQNIVFFIDPPYTAGGKKQENVFINITL